MPHTTPTDLNADARYLRMLADDFSGDFLLMPTLKASELNQNALRLREIAERLQRTGEEG